jgi:hypothetical protein
MLGLAAQLHDGWLVSVNPSMLGHWQQQLCLYTTVLKKLLTGAGTSEGY